MEEEEKYEAGSLYIVEIDQNLRNKPVFTQNIHNDPNYTVDFLKSKLENLLKSDDRLQKKLKKLHKLQNQLSLLINKNIEIKYGQQQENVSPKIVMAPLPPIEKESLSDLLKQIHVISPPELKKFIVKSGIIEQLIFGDSSVFNSQLLSSITRTPPDIQISFIIYILEQISDCSQFYHNLLSMASQFCLDESLRSQLLDSNADLQIFFDFYENSLKKIAEMCKSDDCKIVYCSEESQKLIFPTKAFSFIISSEDSLSGLLIEKVTSSQIEFPRQEESFEAITEGSLFKNNQSVLSIPIRFGKSRPFGLLLLFRELNKFSLTDEKISSKVTEFLTPVFSLFHHIFAHITPSQYNTLFQCISSLRKKEKPLFDRIKEQFCFLTSSATSKIYICDPSSIDFPELKQLPQEGSLVRKCYEEQIVTSYRNPRSHPEFNKEVDDEISFPKISSLLIVPVKEWPIVIVLYNSLTSSEYTSTQKYLASQLSLSLSPLHAEHLMRNQMARNKDGHEKEIESQKTLINSLGHLISNLDNPSFCNEADSFLPNGTKIFLYFFISDNKAFRLPSHEVVQVSANLLAIEEPTIIRDKKKPANKDSSYKCSDKFEINFDSEVNGDHEITSLLVIPSASEYRMVCTLASKDPRIFNDDTSHFFLKFGLNLLLLLPSYVHRYQLGEISRRHQLIKSASQLSTKAISEFVGTEVNCIYFDHPVSQEPRLNKPLSIMVETPKGIEAALTSNTSVKIEQKRNAFISFAELMSSILSYKKISIGRPSDLFISFFVDNGVLDVFECNMSKFTEWITYICSLYENNQIDPTKSIKNSRFVNKLFESKRWENWFSKEERIIIFLIVFLMDISNCWRCKADDNLVSLFSELNCRPVSGLFISVLFGEKFGISDSLPLQKKKNLIKTVDDFVIGETARDFADVSTQVKILSLQGFKVSQKSKVSLGRTFVLISNLCEFDEFNKSLFEEKISNMDDVAKKKMIFRMERIFLPILSYLSQKNELIISIISNVRDALKILHSRKA